MLGLDYGSDSDGKEEEKVPSAVTNEIAAKEEKAKEKGKKSSKKKQAKRAVKSVLVLPPEIQLALAKGVDTSSDDDPDMEERKVAFKRSAAANPKDLFALLPKAKSSTADAMAAASIIQETTSTAVKTTSSSSSNGSSLAAQRSVVVKTVEKRQKGAPSQPLDIHAESAREGQDSDDEEPVSKGPVSLFTLPPPRPAGGMMSIRRVVAAPPVSQRIEPIEDEPSEERTYVAPAPPPAAVFQHTPTAYETAVPVHQQYNQQSYQQQHKNTSHAYNDNTNYDGGVEESDQSIGKGGRVRDRDVQRLLASGKIDALSAATSYQAADPASFNPFAQGAMPPPGTEKTETVITGRRYNPSTGETEQVVGATKGQKRKHQINSLAGQAAARELELMEKRGAGHLTKAQTQAKYGW